MKLAILGEDGTFKGGFINALITFIYLGLIVTGIFYVPVSDQIVKLQSFMMWFFAISFGMWSAKKTIETVMGDKTLKVTTEQVPPEPPITPPMG